MVVKDLAMLSPKDPSISISDRSIFWMASSIQANGPAPPLYKSDQGNRRKNDGDVAFGHMMKSVGNGMSKTASCL